MSPASERGSRMARVLRDIAAANFAVDGTAYELIAEAPVESSRASSAWLVNRDTGELVLSYRPRARRGFEPNRVIEHAPEGGWKIPEYRRAIPRPIDDETLNALHRVVARQKKAARVS